LCAVADRIFPALFTVQVFLRVLIGSLAKINWHSLYVPLNAHNFSFTVITKCSQEEAEKEVASEEARQTRSCLPLTEQKIAIEENRINSQREKKKCISESCTGKEEK